MRALSEVEDAPISHGAAGIRRKMIRSASLATLFLLAVTKLTIAASASDGAPLARTHNPIEWGPEAIHFCPRCATNYWRFPRSERCDLSLALDSSGRLHVFIAEIKLGPEKDTKGFIEHYLISKGEINQLPSIATHNASVKGLRSEPSPGGLVHLLWIEDRYWAPQFHDYAVYLKTLSMDKWDDSMVVLDQKARPWTMSSLDIALSADREGSLDLFWLDGREFHPLADVLTMGHAGNYEKTYHRKLTDSGWTEPEQVQPRGRRSIPMVFKPFPSGGPIGLLWTVHGSWTASIVQSALVKGEWGEIDTVGQCRSGLGYPTIYDVETLTGSDVGSKVAWTCKRYEYVEPGTRKSSAFSNLFISAQMGNKWKTGPKLSRNASVFRWLGSRGGKSLLALQETSGIGPQRERNVPLFALEIEGNMSKSRVVIAEHTVEGFLETATSSDGTFHMIYAVPTSDSEATLVYRSGRLVDP